MTRPALPRGPPRPTTSDTLHGTVVPDPYRWLEDADEPGDRGVVARAGRAARRETGRGVPGRDRLRGAGRRRCSAPASSAPRRGAASGSSSCAAPPTQEHAVLLTVDPDGTERVLVDPIAHRPDRRDDPGRLAAVQGGRPARLPALRGRHRGVACCTSSTSPPASGVDGPIDRTRYSPVAWLPGGEALLLRTPAARRTQVPADEAQYHRRVWLHRLGTDPADDVEVLRRRAGQDQLLRRHRVDGRPLAGRSARRPAPRRATTCGWPTCPTARLEAPDAAGRAGGRGRQHVAARRPRRPGLPVHRPRRARAAGSR